MRATELRSVLTGLADLLRAGGARQSASDLGLLARRLAASDNISASDAISKFDAELCGLKPTVKDYVRDLVEAGKDEKRFDKIFAALKSDKSIKKSEAIQVMKGYAGKHVRARTKADAFDEIQRTFARILYDANAERQAATTPW